MFFRELPDKCVFVLVQDGISPVLVKTRGKGNPKAEVYELVKGPCYYTTAKDLSVVGPPREVPPEATVQVIEIRTRYHR